MRGSNENNLVRVKRQFTFVFSMYLRYGRGVEIAVIGDLLCALRHAV